MTLLPGLIVAPSAIVLFLYGLQGLSGELQTVGGDALNSRIVQSSSASMVLAVTLVDAGAIALVFLLTLDQLDPRLRRLPRTSRKDLENQSVGRTSTSVSEAPSR
jgi:hypothetical protein